MKNTCLLISLVFLLSTAAKAQEQYIEVVVTDTMMVEPREWNYFLMLQSGDEAAASETEANKPQSKGKEPAKTQPYLLRQQTLDSIRTIAANFGGQITGDPSSLNFTMLPKSYVGNTDPEYLSIKFNSRSGIENFVRAINKRGDIEGRITATSHPDLPPFTDRLNARLVNMAKQKAEKLAQLAGRKCGAVILISEVAEPAKNLYQGLFEKMVDADRSSWLPDWVAQSADGSTDKIKLEKTLRIRFALL